MSGKHFLDTNILIYLYSEKEEQKRQKACNVINTYYCITSTQTLNEASNVWIKKYGWDAVKIKEHLDNIKLVCDEVVEIHKSTIDFALDLHASYGYSYYDCLMLSSAIENNCEVILTEDMGDSQIINNELTITNPFK